MATVDSATSLYGTSYSGDLGVNPDSVLDKDDFLKLLLAQLQYQDPTAPMESEQILQQTSQLASLEAQQNTNSALEQLSKSFQQSKDLSAVAAIGKMARLDTKIQLNKNLDGSMQPVSFPLEFAENVDTGQIRVFNDKGNLVKTMDIEGLEKGSHTINWDGLNDAGENVETGEYTIQTIYKNPDGVTLSADFGAYKIESVKFEDEKTYLKINGAFLPFEEIEEIFEATEA